MGHGPVDLAHTLVRRAAAAQRADEADAARCRVAVAEAVSELRRVRGVGRVWLIGSLAWGGFGVRSDVDLVVESASDDTLLDVAERVGAATGRVVEALALERLPESFRVRVLAEGVRVT